VEPPWKKFNKGEKTPGKTQSAQKIMGKKEFKRKIGKNNPGHPVKKLTRKGKCPKESNPLA